MAEWLKAIAVILGVGLIFVMVRMEAVNPPPVDDGTTAAGVVVSWTYHPKKDGDGDMTVVETEKKIYTVMGRYSTAKGHRLVIKPIFSGGKNSSARWLMDEEQHTVSILMNTYTW